MHCLLRCLPVAQQLLRPPVSSALAGGLPFQQHRSVHWRGSGYLGTGSVGDQAGQEEEPRFLVTGACGQIGSELIPFLRARVGVENVVASDVKASRQMLDSGPWVYLDVTDKDSMARIAMEHGVTHVVHLATLLSAVGERNPQLALRVNTVGIHNVLDLAAQHGLRVFAPSTIAVFGPTSPREATPNDTLMQPRTMYGITKVHQELLGQYYRDKFGVDYRSVRFPGIISSKAPPGGGTTDYAVEVFHHALKSGSYTCFLSEDAELPMMYMPDALEAVWTLVNAPRTALTATTYNVTAMSFRPRDLAEVIGSHLPHFDMKYTPDFRDEIAKTWPRSLDDSLARSDWGWKPRYDLPAMAKDMLAQLARQYNRQQQQYGQQPGRQAQAPQQYGQHSSGLGHFGQGVAGQQGQRQGQGVRRAGVGAEGLGLGVLVGMPSGNHLTAAASASAPAAAACAPSHTAPSACVGGAGGSVVSRAGSLIQGGCCAPCAGAEGGEGGAKVHAHGLATAAAS